jgi:hypothetical protein
MKQGKFITSLPGHAGGPNVSVVVAEADDEDAALWDEQIQDPYVRNSGRIDAKWRWQSLFFRSTLLERMAGRRLAFLQLQTQASNGKVFVVGQVLLAAGYPYPPDRRKPCVFLWYLAGAPKDAAKAAGVADYTGVLAALVDCAIQFSFLRGYDGRLCLHVSPKGSKAQRRKLMEQYLRVGVEKWVAGGWFARLMAGWFRRNDGRYCYADHALAAKLTAKLDIYR